MTFYNEVVGPPEEDYPSAQQDQKTDSLPRSNVQQPVDTEQLSIDKVRSNNMLHDDAHSESSYSTPLEQETPLEKEKPESIPPKMEQSKPPPKPGFFQRIKAAAGLDVPTVLLMAKGAMPPIVALAAYQATPVAEEYTTLGYLIAIMSLLSMCIMPRAKFIQAMFTSVCFVCLGAAVACLQIRCCVSARQSTSPPAQPSRTGTSGSSEAVAYNASASTVSAIFMFCSVYIVNFAKASRPQIMLPAIQYSIFTLVTSVYAPHFPTMVAGLQFVDRLLKTFLTGFGIATGISFLILPMTSRMISGKQMGGLLGLIKQAINLHSDFIGGVHDLSRLETIQSDTTDKKDHKVTSPGEEQAKKLKQNIVAMSGLFAKIKIEIGFAKKEIAFGKLSPEDFSDIYLNFRRILLPTIGMSTYMDIMDSIKSHKAEAAAEAVQSEELIQAIKHLEAHEWQEIVATSHDAFALLKAALMDGLTHIGYVLELTKKPKVKKGDVEKDAQTRPQPGDPGFTDYLQEQVHMFFGHRREAMRNWCGKKGIDLPQSFWDNPDSQYSWKEQIKANDTARRIHNQQQLYLVLYLQYLVWSIGKAILAMCRYADGKVTDGTMTKKRLINPGWHRLKKLVLSHFDKTDSDAQMADGQNAANSVWVGDSLKSQKDPEHLPPTNAYQKITHEIRRIPAILSSPASSFAFRAAVAAMSLGVLAFLRPTYRFFLEQRGVWALIMTAISMDSHAGRGVFGFIMRTLGTVVAMVLSMAIWYIGDQKVAAILPVHYVFLTGGIWFLLKHPDYAVVAVISMVTSVLIIGYEVVESKIGLEATTANGQAYYPVYLLGPYRLATVAAGLFTGFVWTYFPYPVTTHRTLRKDLGSTLYLMANYYSCVHTTVGARLKYGAQFTDQGKASPLYRLDKARSTVFSKIIPMMSKLREHQRFTKYELTFGGRFPEKLYDDLIRSMQHIFNYILLIEYSTNAFVSEPDAEESNWLRDFREFTADLKLTSHDITSTLCLVSASMSNAQPLPPYLRGPKPFGLAERMESFDPEVLSIKHVNEPCYAAFAVLEVASTLITEELALVVKKVQELVGEVDFSFHVISTTGGDDRSSIASTLFDTTEKKARKKD